VLKLADDNGVDMRFAAAVACCGDIWPVRLYRVTDDESQAAVSSDDVLPLCCCWSHRVADDDAQPPSACVTTAHSWCHTPHSAPVASLSGSGCTGLELKRFTGLGVRTKCHLGPLLPHIMVFIRGRVETWQRNHSLTSSKWRINTLNSEWLDCGYVSSCRTSSQLIRPSKSRTTLGDKSANLT